MWGGGVRGSGDVEIFHCHRIKVRGVCGKILLTYRRSGEGVWKDSVAINGSECVRALTCIAIDDPCMGGGRREELSALTPTPNRIYIGSGSKSY